MYHLEMVALTIGGGHLCVRACVCVCVGVRVGVCVCMHGVVYTCKTYQHTHKQTTKSNLHIQYMYTVDCTLNRNLYMYIEGLTDNTHSH